MDDYLAKPVTRAGFAEKLARFRGGMPLSVPPQAQVECNAPRPAIFDEAIFAELANTLGARDIRLVSDTFLAETGKRLDAMRAAANAGDNSLIKREAHTIKSAAASLGLLRLSGLAKALEADALGLNRPELDARIDPVAESFAEVQDIFESNLPPLPATAQLTNA